MSSDDPLVIAARLVSISSKEEAERMARDIQLRGDEATLLSIDDFGESQLSDIFVEASQKELDAQSSQLGSSNAIEATSETEHSVESQLKVTFVLTLLDLTSGDFGDEHWSMLKESLSLIAGVDIIQANKLFV